MKRFLTFLLLCSICFLVSPLNSFAATTKSRNVYGINRIYITDDTLRISGWAYRTFTNFCNVENQTYGNYNMKDSSGNYLTDDDTKKSISSKCSGKKYGSVVYKVVAIPKYGGKKIYAKGTNDSTNLRRLGTSATCVNYYKPSTLLNNSGASVHCDGKVALFGDFPSEPIDYERRNYNVDQDVNGYYEGNYFYDDIGFSGSLDLKELEDNMEYKLYLEMTVDGKTYSFSIAAPGLVVSLEGVTLKSKTASKIEVKNTNLDFVLNYSLKFGVINQDSGNVYRFLNKDGFQQYTKSKGGGYFKPSEQYDILDIVEFQNIELSNGGNLARLGGFDLYNLSTTSAFSNGYILPGDDSDKYYAMSTWVSFTGALTLLKTAPKTDDCGGTDEGSTSRIMYCHLSPKPNDYDKCCGLCGGTLEGTLARENYCAMNPTDSTCCRTVGLCPAESTDDLDPADHIYYTYWDTSVTFENKFTSAYKNGTSNVKNYPKYCSGVDSTSTMITTDDMLQQYNNAFCYQKGSFSTTSPNQADYILTYSGGAYSLNVNYNTDLVCVSLANRRVTNVKYYDENCNYKGQASNDGEVHFKDDGYTWNSTIDSNEETYTYWGTCTQSNNCPSQATNCPSTVQVPCQQTVTFKSGIKYTYTENLDYNRNGKFAISSLEEKLKIVPTLYLKDSTTNQVTTKFNTETKVTKNDTVSTYANNNSSLMMQYINDRKTLDPDFSDPLSGSTKSTFVQKVVLKRYIDNYASGVRSFGSASYSCRSTSLGDQCSGETAYDNFVDNCAKKADSFDKKLRYQSGHYYGDLNLYYENVSESKTTSRCGKITCTTRYTYTCKYKVWYEGEVTKTMYVTIEDSYKEENMNLVANYTLSSDSVPDSIKERFEDTNEKYVSQVNLSDYYQITMGSNDYDKDKNSGKYFGIAETWNMDKALCALDLTDHDCDPSESTCACKYNGASLEKGVYYSECLDFRVVSTNSLFPGKGNYKCENPLRLCRQPGRNWSKYLETGLLSSNNIDYVKDKPMYHIVLTPSVMNNIINNNKDYYTNIDLTGYNPSKCTYAGDSRCSYDYWSTMLNGLDSSVFTRNYDIINLRYRQLKALGANEYKTSKVSSSGGE